MNIGLIGEKWYEKMEDEFSKSYMVKLKDTLKKLYRSKTNIFPHAKDLFRAFKLTDPDTVKVVLLGQDPYHNGSADGLAFSSRSIKRPRSLQVIMKEIDKELYKSTTAEEFKKNFSTNSLDSWANQGVLLLNTLLSIEQGKPQSHKWIGWEPFIDKVLDILVEGSPKVFITWGKDAIDRIGDRLEGTIHLHLQSGHPATQLYGKDTFSGHQHFSKTNQFLIEQNLEPINWKT